MKTNERFISALNKAIEICPEVELVKLIRYLSSVDEMAYLTDEDIATQLEHYNKMAETCTIKSLYDYNIKPDDVLYMDRFLCVDDCKYYDFSKENENIAYERYRKRTEGRFLGDLVEIVNMKDFLERFQLEYVEAEEYSDITVINHRDTFLNVFPMAYRQMNGYIVGRKGDKYIAKHVYLVKNPCFGELMDYAMKQCQDEYDECLVITIDWCESPRFTDYTRHIMYGMEYKKNEKVLEIYNEHQTIEKFHAFFQKANKIISNWEGIVYDDKTWT